MADDALALHGRPDHEPWHVRQKQEWNVEGIAEPDESRRLVGRVHEQDAAFVHRLVGDHADHPTVDAGEPADDLPGVELLDLEEATAVDHPVDQLLHIERPPFVLGDEGIQGHRWPGLDGRPRGWRLLPVLRDVSKETAAGFDRFFFRGHQQVAAATHGGVHPCATHFLQRHLLADHHLGHPR